MNGAMIDKNIAKKYAQAFIAVFPKSFGFNDIKKVDVACDFLQAHKRTLFFLQLPQFNQNRRRSMVADLVDYFSLPYDFSAVILLLINHNRSFYIPDTLRWITQLYKNSLNCTEFSIQTTQEIDDHDIDSIKKFLSHITHKKIIGVPLINTKLIAGVRLQSNEYLWEYSIRKHIRAVQGLKR